MSKNQVTSKPWNWFSPVEFLNLRFWGPREYLDSFGWKSPWEAVRSHQRASSGARPYLKLYFYDTDPKSAEETREREGMGDREKSWGQTHGVTSATYMSVQPCRSSQKLSTLNVLERHLLWASQLYYRLQLWLCVTALLLPTPTQMPYHHCRATRALSPQP